jgi:hypothetical protein
VQLRHSGRRRHAGDAAHQGVVPRPRERQVKDKIPVVP